MLPSSSVHPLAGHAECFVERPNFKLRPRDVTGAELFGRPQRQRHRAPGADIDRVEQRLRFPGLEPFAEVFEELLG
jgi:hypothetical protein